MDMRLLAFDAEDLAVISAHVQDAAVAADDMAWLAAERRFALVCTRQDHAEGGAPRPAGLHFDHVLKVERLRLPPAGAGDAPLTLIGLGFEPTDAPSGHVTLLFNGGAAIRLTVDCVEAAMRDLAPATKD
jgi:hypothetical protein